MNIIFFGMSLKGIEKNNNMNTLTVKIITFVTSLKIKNNDCVYFVLKNKPLIKETWEVMPTTIVITNSGSRGTTV